MVIETKLPGRRFRDLLLSHQPLAIVGTVHAYAALLAAKHGFNALYLSGAGVANASLGLPDIGDTQLRDVLIDAERIIQATGLPLLVDIDTGWEDSCGIAASIVQLATIGVAAVHIEDQISAKKCGHLTNKQLVTTEAMQLRIKQAVDAKPNDDFVVMARTDAVSPEGLSAAIERSLAYVDAGADMIFVEALTSLESYRLFVDQVPVPILANMTEFGVTPYFSLEDFASVGVAMVLYPLSAFRAMNAAAAKVYQSIEQTGSQQICLDDMETRDQLYQILGYGERTDHIL